MTRPGTARDDRGGPPRRSGSALLPGRCDRLCAAAVLLLASAAAQAGPLTVRAADGSDWRINDEVGTVIERHLPNGRLDTRFAQDGRLAYTLGHADAGTAALRVDAAGRLWVAGNSAATGSSMPVVMRFTPAGQPDTTWGPNGRSVAAPPGQQLVVQDLLPMSDGSVWVAGDALGSPSGQHAAVWHVKEDGSVDLQFGGGGLWQRPGRDRTRALSLAEGPDGVVAFGLEAPEGTETLREFVLLRPGERMPQPGGHTPLDEDEEDDAYLTWDGLAWRWETGVQEAMPAGPAAAAQAAASLSASAADAGQSAFSPFVGASAVEAASAPEDAAPGPLAVVVLLLGILGGLWWWHGSAKAKRSGKPRR